MGGMEEHQKIWGQRQRMLNQLKRLRNQIEIEKNRQTRKELKIKLDGILTRFDALFGAPPNFSWIAPKRKKPKTVSKLRQNRRV